MKPWPNLGNTQDNDVLFLINVMVFIVFSADGSGTIMVRGCALDSGTLTTDTEIIRMSHCGSFYFDDR